MEFRRVLLGAAVIEETRPPPVVVVSWAATSEAAARMMTCENFMLKDVVIELIDGRSLFVYWLIVGLMMVVVKKGTPPAGQEGLYTLRLLPQWGPRSYPHVVSTC